MYFFKVWEDILQIAYIIEKPPNFENPFEFEQFQVEYLFSFEFYSIFF